MPTIIDSLVVTLGLDPSGFDEGQSKAVATLRRLELQAGRSGHAIESSLGSSFKAVAGVILGLDAPLALLFRHLEGAITHAGQSARKSGEVIEGTGKKIGEAVKKGGDEAEEATKSGSHGMMLLAGTALVALAAVMALTKAMGAFKETAKDIATTGLRATTSGMTTQDLSAFSTGLHLAAPLVSTEEAEQTTAKLAARFGPASRGEDPEYWRALGMIHVPNIRAQGMDLLHDLAVRFAQMPLRNQTGTGALDLGGKLGFSDQFILGLREMGKHWEQSLARGREFAITKGQADAADRFNKALAEMEAQFTKLAQVLFEVNEGLLEGFVKDLSEIAQIGQALAKHDWAKLWELTKDLASRQFHWATGGGDRPDPTREGGPLADPAEREKYIRAEAVKYGINPDVAMRVARSEGFNVYAGDEGTSFGSFQLHVGGGLGDRYRQETGKDPADPKNEPDMIRWTLAHLRETGWGPYHGAANVGVGLREGIDPVAPPSAPQAGYQLGGFVPTDQVARLHAGEMVFPADVTSLLLQSIRAGRSQQFANGPVSNDNSVTIGDVVVYTQATDPRGIAQAVQDSLRRNLMAANASTGFVG